MREKMFSCDILVIVLGVLYLAYVFSLLLNARGYNVFIRDYENSFKILFLDRLLFLSYLKKFVGYIPHLISFLER